MDRGGVRKESGKEQGERRDKGVTGTQRRVVRGELTVLNVSQSLYRMGTEKWHSICHAGSSRSHIWADVLIFSSLGLG